MPIALSCDACGRSIADSALLRFEDKTFHYICFRCKVCQRSLAGVGAKLGFGALYCPNHVPKPGTAPEGSSRSRSTSFRKSASYDAAPRPGTAPSVEFGLTITSASNRGLPRIVKQPSAEVDIMLLPPKESSRVPPLIKGDSVRNRQFLVVPPPVAWHDITPRTLNGQAPVKLSGVLRLQSPRVVSAALANADNVEYAHFVERFPDYLDTAVLDEVRDKDYRRLDKYHHTYLDYTGGALYPASLITAYNDFLQEGVYGNPHSANPTSATSTRYINECRAQIFKQFNADESVYDLAWTPNASGALKLVGESYPFDSNCWLLISADDHNSVNGVREVNFSCSANHGSRLNT
eukprot:TRINITY_DN2670_c0_g1_i4.p1 TRINITY_DN2670_c0_g1~~TRINITY_DN2670_c0_g1_i4.p1  ORF type:complete len:349 (+),score=81.28 TRINITY_DN2670_c0_g1_i4:128-1174(+)